jgi:hypothetical protein
MTRANQRAFSLDHVVARNISIHWDEAVAVVEDLCSVLTAGAEERPVPDLGDILITGDGRVALQSDARGTRGPNGVGRTLHALLSAGDVPVALRLFVTQATSLNTYASLGECAAALAYFGKPDRAELIRAVYVRCVAAGDAAPGTMAARELAPNPQVAKPQTDKSVQRRPIPPWAVVAASAACVFAAAMGLWFAATNRSGATASTIPVLAAQTKKALRQLGTEVRSALGVAAAPAKLAEQDKSTSPLAKASLPRVTRGRDGRRPVVALIREPVQVAPPLEPVVVADQPVPVEAPTLEDLARENERRTQVYTRTDLDVQPPLLVYPQLPPQLVAGNRAGAVNTMEIVVSETGDVMHVRLIDGPRRMPDMMLLSGAKMWRFQPAVKDGDPVRYRTVVSWLGGP